MNQGDSAILNIDHLGSACMPILLYELAQDRDSPADLLFPIFSRLDGRSTRHCHLLPPLPSPILALKYFGSIPCAAIMPGSPFCRLATLAGLQQRPEIRGSSLAGSIYHQRRSFDRRRIVSFSVLLPPGGNHQRTSPLRPDCTAAVLGLRRKDHATSTWRCHAKRYMV